MEFMPWWKVLGYKLEKVLAYVRSYVTTEWWVKPYNLSRSFSVLFGVIASSVLAVFHAVLVSAFLQRVVVCGCCLVECLLVYGHV